MTREERIFLQVEDASRFFFFSPQRIPQRERERGLRPPACIGDEGGPLALLLLSRAISSQRSYETSTMRVSTRSRLP